MIQIQIDDLMPVNSMRNFTLDSHHELAIIAERGEHTTTLEVRTDVNTKQEHSEVLEGDTSTDDLVSSTTTEPVGSTTSDDDPNNWEWTEQEHSNDTIGVCDEATAQGDIPRVVVERSNDPCPDIQFIEVVLT